MKHNTCYSGLLATTAAAMLLTACGNNDHRYTITGVVGSEVPGLEVVHLADLNGQIQVTDTLTADGTFTFTGEVDTTLTVGYILGDRAHRAIIFLEPGEIRVDLTKRTAEGTPLNDEYTAYSAAIEAIPEDSSINTDSIVGALSSELYLRHKDDALGTLVFQDIAYTVSADQLQELLADAPERIKNNPHYSQLLELKLAEQATGVGTHYLNVTGLDAAASTQADKSVEPEGPQLALSTFADNGRLTLVDFWASWCGPCRREIPNIAAVAAQYAGQVDVIGVAVWDQLIDTQRAMGELGITWPVIFSSKATEAYGIAGIPHIMLIGADGTILARDLRGEGIGRAIEAALAQE